MLCKPTGYTGEKSKFTRQNISVVAQSQLAAKIPPIHQITPTTHISRVGEETEKTGVSKLVY